jgi:CheY-like chemotaxis protein
MQPYILLIDDDEDDQFIFLAAIKEAAPGYACRVSNNGPEGLCALTSNSSKPDFIFLDLNMPLMNGFEFLVILMNDVKLSGIPVIIFSTSDNPADKKRARDLGALKFITKTANIQLLKRDLIHIFNSELLST